MATRFLPSLLWSSAILSFLLKELFAVGGREIRPCHLWRFSTTTPRVECLEIPDGTKMDVFPSSSNESFAIRKILYACMKTKEFEEGSKHVNRKKRDNYLWERWESETFNLERGWVEVLISPRKRSLFVNLSSFPLRKRENLNLATKISSWKRPSNGCRRNLGRNGKKGSDLFRRFAVRKQWDRKLVQKQGWTKEIRVTIFRYQDFHANEEIHEYEARNVISSGWKVLLPDIGLYSYSSHWKKKKKRNIKKKEGRKKGRI